MKFEVLNWFISISNIENSLPSSLKNDLFCRRSLSLTEEEWRFVMFIDGKEKGRVDVEIIELKRQS